MKNNLSALRIHKITIKANLLIFATLLRTPQNRLLFCAAQGNVRTKQPISSDTSNVTDISSNNCKEFIEHVRLCHHSKRMCSTQYLSASKSYIKYIDVCVCVTKEGSDFLIDRVTVGSTYTEH